MAKTKTIKLNKSEVLSDMYRALYLLEQEPLASNKDLQNFINSFSCTLMDIEDGEITEETAKDFDFYTYVDRKKVYIN